MIEIRVTGDKEVAASLDLAASRSIPAVRAVVEHGANNIKTDARARISGLAHAPAYPDAISYDVTYGMGSVTGEVGPRKERRQGALGNILEYGTVNNPPIPHLGPALRTEEPKFIDALEALGVDLLGGS